MPETFQANQYSPITAYDMPGVLFQQVLDNETTWSGIKNTLLQPHKLSPEERNSFTDNLKKQAGRSPVTDSLIDIALNPFVWFAFITTPGVGGAIGRGTKSLYEGSKYGAFVREHTPYLMSLGLWNANSIYRNTPLGQAINKMSDSRRQFIGEVNNRKRGIELEIIGQLRAEGIKIKSLDPLAAPPKHRKLLTDIDFAINAKLNGWDRPGVTQIAVAKPKWKVDRFVKEEQDLHRNFSSYEGTLDEDALRVTQYEQKVLGKAASQINQGKSVDEVLESLRKNSVSEDFPGGKLTADYEMRSGNTLRQSIESGETIQLTKIEQPLERGVEAISFDKPMLVNPNGKMKDLIDKYNLTPLIDAHKLNLDEQMIKLYGQEDLLARYDNNASNVINAFREGQINIDDLIDTDKVLRISKSSSNPAMTEVMTDPLSNESTSITAGRRLLTEFYDIRPTDVVNMSQEQVGRQIRRVFEVHLKNEQYFPFGLSEHVGKDGRPLYQGGKMEARAQRAAVASGMNIPKVQEPSEHLYHLDDLDLLSSFARGESLAENAVGVMQNKTAAALGKLPQGSGVAVRRINANRSLHLYTQRAAETYALHVAGVTTKNGVRTYDPEHWDHITDTQRLGAADLQRTESGRARSTQKLYDTEGFGDAKIGDVFMDLAADTHGPGGFSMSDVVNQVYKGMDSSQEFSRALLKDTLIPRLMGRRTIAEMSNYSMSALVKDVSKRFADGPIGDAISKSGTWGKGLVDEMREAGAAHSPFNSPRMASGQVAKYLYVTHLGTNMASVLLNLTQPWMHTATLVGIDSVLAGYGRAFAELGDYASKRFQSGKLRLSDDEKMKFINDSFVHAKDDLLGIGPDVFALQDQVTNFGARELPSAVETGLFEMPMKLFEKSEWLNRLVSSHAVDHAFQKAGRYVTEGADARFRLRSIKDIVDETQFGGSVMNTPSIFMGKGALGQMGDSPIVRQFLTFPLRTLTAITPGVGHVSQEIGGGRRSFIGGKEFDLGPLSNLFDFTRGMGIAAALYYTGKNFLDADVSRGLIANASTDMFGGSDFLEGGEYDWLPIPPAVDMLAQSTRGILGGDMELLQRTLPRFVPSGVGLARVLSIQPENMGLGQNALGDLVGNFQRSYADWDNPTPDGLVPFYKGDGTFVDFRDPSELVFQGLGMDVGKSKLKGELDGYLVKQREEILKYRNEYLNALFANNIGKAMKMKKEFERRFKIPLTITKENLRSRMRNRNISRTERILDRIPPEARGQYMGFLAARGKEMGIDPAAYTGETPTSTSRSKEFDRPTNYDLDPETIKILKQMVEDKKKEPPPIQQSSFTESYSTFEQQ